MSEKTSKMGHQISLYESMIKTKKKRE